jgi:transposase
MSLNNRRLTAPDIRKSLSNDYGVDVTPRTIQNRLMEAGLYGRVARRKPLISEKNRIARLNWAKEHANWTIQQWECVLWSDESKFNLFGSDGQVLVRRRAGEAMNSACVVPTVKHGGGNIMVWASMSAYGPGPIRLVEGVMDQYQYRSILEETMLPAAQNLFADRRWIFQHDNDPKHTAKSVKQWIEDQDFHCLWWPAQSPDLNPIEHLWQDVDLPVKNFRPSNKEELFRVVNDAWRGILSSRCRNLVQSMGRRCKAVIDAKGGPTKY